MSGFKYGQNTSSNSSFKTPTSNRNEFVETLVIIVQAVVLAIGIQLVAYQPFFIPSESMLGTLLKGDYLGVSKFSYGYSWASWPVAPMQPLKDVLPSGRLFGQEPRRGDVVVFKLPSDGKTDYIKRVIGMPEDRIQMVNGVLYVNETAIPKKPVADFIAKNDAGTEKRISQFEETLPNGVTYRVLDEKSSAGDNTPVFKVPSGHYFMMGDNRDNSQDSRFIGFVPFDHLVGRADFLAISVTPPNATWEFWNWSQSMRTERFFTKIQ